MCIYCHRRECACDLIQERDALRAELASVRTERDAAVRALRCFGDPKVVESVLRYHDRHEALDWGGGVTVLDFVHARAVIAKLKGARKGAGKDRKR